MFRRIESLKLQEYIPKRACDLLRDKFGIYLAKFLNYGGLLVGLPITAKPGYHIPITEFSSPMSLLIRSVMYFVYTK